MQFLLKNAVILFSVLLLLSCGDSTTTTPAEDGSSLDGVYYYNAGEDMWHLITGAASQIITGDLDGDHKDDVIGVWENQGGVWVLYSASEELAKLASVALDIKTCDMNGDGKDDLIGSWTDNGIYYRDSETGNWSDPVTETASTVIACGDLDDDGLGDVAAIINGKIYIYYSETLEWTLLSTDEPRDMVMCDVTGDGRDDFAGSWDDGVYYQDSKTGAWSFELSVTAEELACADIDGDALDDVIGNFAADSGTPGVWIRYSSTGSWVELATMADDISTGDTDGNGTQEVLGTWQ